MSMPDDQPGDTLLGAQMHRTGGSLSTPPQNWNQPRPGYQGPPPGYPYGPPPPPKKKRTGLVVGIVVGVVALAVAGVFGKLYLDYTADPGGGPGETPVAQCKISESLQREAHTSSFRLAMPPDDGASGLEHSLCAWEQTKGKDGKDKRVLSFHVYHYRDFPEGAKSNYERTSKGLAAGDLAKPIDGLGDEAAFIAPDFKPDLSTVDLVVRKGEIVYLISYTGHNRGFFTDSEFPLSEGEAITRKTAEELVNR